MRLAFLSAHRKLDAADRQARARRAFAAAKASGARHLIVTGDLTEDGASEQFEVFAELIAESGIAPEQVTLLPGNHDAYGGKSAFAKALEGPLRAFAATSVRGAPIDLEGVSVVPLCTAVDQSFVVAGGRIGEEEIGELAAVTRARKGRAVIAAMHHPPVTHPVRLIAALRGLRGAEAFRAMMGEHAGVHVVHGHMHHRFDHGIAAG